jgi:hypothetical protein
LKKGEVECEYFSENQTCKALFENKKGRAVRERSCKNHLKDACCYLCEHQESCKIGCDYLDETEGFAEHRRNMEREILKRKKAIERVTTFFAEGKINEHSYLTSVSKLEREIERLGKLKDNPEAPQIDSQPYEQDEEDIVPFEKPSSSWYLVPFFFGIIGGLLAYVGTKDRDEDMAVNLLVFGIAWTILLAAIAWSFFMYVFG